MKKTTLFAATLLSAVILGSAVTAGADVSVGSTVTFGTYEQDNNTSNGAEPITWKVLAVEGGRALLLSEYVLDDMPYHNVREDITWENCSLRAWLNSTFLNTAFTAAEQAKIPTVTVTADEHPLYSQASNPSYASDPGNDTNDQVFLLSAVEIEKYFPGDAETMCYPTEYAFAKNVAVNKEFKDRDWWLRSPFINKTSGPYTQFAATCCSKELYRQLTGGSGKVVDIAYGVRPAIWMTIN